MRLLFAILVALFSVNGFAANWQHSHQHTHSGGIAFSHQYNSHSGFEVTKGNGVSASEERALENFDGIQIQIPAEVVFQQQDETSVTITADQNLLPLIDTEISNGNLVIFAKPGFSTTNSIKLIVRAPDLKTAKLQAGGTLNIESLETEKLHLQLNSSGQIWVSGKIDMMLTDLLGSGTIDSSQVKSQNCRIRLQGAGTMNLFCEESLQAYLLGSGLVTISGAPEHRQINGWGATQVLFN